MMRAEIDDYIKKNLGIDDRETLDMLYDNFKSTADENIEKIRSALDKNDAAALAFSAHALKGCAANIGCEPIRALCLAMELSGKRGETEFSKNEFSKLLDLRKEL